MNENPSSQQVIEERRASVLDFIAAALFTDREAGVQLAAKIAAGDVDPEAGSAHPEPGLRRKQRKRK